MIVVVFKVKKIYPGPEFELGSLALRTCALTTELSRTSAGSIIESHLYIL